jgi:hypothetical protein
LFRIKIEKDQTDLITKLVSKSVSVLGVCQILLTAVQGCADKLGNLERRWQGSVIITEKQKALAALASQVSLFSKEAGVISLPSTASIVAWSLPASASGTAATQVIGVP